MRAFRNIIDTWNMVEKYQVKGYVDVDYKTVLIPEAEYQRIIVDVKNRKYIKNLVRQNAEG